MSDYVKHNFTSGQVLTALQMTDIDNAIYENREKLEKFQEQDGKLTYNGEEIGSGISKENVTTQYIEGKTTELLQNNLNYVGDGAIYSVIPSSIYITGEDIQKVESTISGYNNTGNYLISPIFKLDLNNTIKIKIKSKGSSYLRHLAIYDSQKDQYFLI